MTELYSTYEIRGNPPLSFGVVLLDQYTASVKSFSLSPDNGEPIWDFLCYLKKLILNLKSSNKEYDFYSFHGMDREHRFILKTLAKHGEEPNITFPQGLLQIKWDLTPNILNPKSRNKRYIIFKPTQIFLMWKDLSSVAGANGLTYPAPEFFLDHYKDSDNPYAFPILNLSWLLTEKEHLLERDYPGLAKFSPSTSIPTLGTKINQSLSGFDFRRIEFPDVHDKLPFIKQCTFGGRNEVYKRYGENINVYDQILHYVSRFDTPIPVGRLSWVTPNIDKGTFAEATVKVPKDWYIGPLPYNHQGIICYPIGTFTHWWDIIELRNAARLGVDMTLRRMLQSDQELPILETFGKEIFKKIKEKPHERQFWKMLGDTTAIKTLQLRSYDKIITLTNLDAKNPDMEAKIPLGYYPLYEDDETFWVGTSSIEEDLGKEKKTYRSVPPYLKPQVGVRILAAGRIAHLNTILKAHSMGNIFYCDNDSIYTTSFLPHSNELLPKTLKKEGSYSRGYFIRQKLYALIKGEEIVLPKAAGFSIELKKGLTEKDFKDLLEGKEVAIQTDYLIPTEKEILMGERFSTKIRNIPLKGSYPKNRIYDGLDSTPIVIND